MKAFFCALWLCLWGFGCARIYRPVSLAQGRPSPQAVGLSAVLDLQPWGDNSRYEDKALRSNLRVLVLSLENHTGTDLEALRLELPDSTSALSAEAAFGLVKQQPLLYLLYPFLPGLMIPGASNKGSFGPSEQAGYSVLAVVGLGIGIPNVAIAAQSNARLAAFFKDNAWTPGPLQPGQSQRGLVFLRSPDPYAPLKLQLKYRDALGEQGQELVCPAIQR
ncbi:MAG TPA: hypothetical protein VF378_06300 [Geothrix sp.]